MLSQALKLYLVTHVHTSSFAAYKNFLLQAIAGGVTAVQLRAKNQPPDLIYQQAFELKKLLDPFQIPLILNDHVEVAVAIDAAGVHLGQTDLAPNVARKILGANKIIGLSIETEAQLLAANAMEGVDYVAASAVFASRTKLDCKTIWGLEGLQKISRLSRHPLIAIGGIDKTNIAAVLQSGAVGVAVVSAIHSHVNPQQAAAELFAAGFGGHHVHAS